MNDRTLSLFLAAGALLIAAGGGYVAMSNRKWGATWDRLTPATRAKVEELEKRAKAAGLDAMFFAGWRSIDESAKNMASSASKVKDPRSSYHVWGLAFDMAFANAAGLPWWPPDDDPRWPALARLGASIGLFSGGLNWGWDWGHFQMPGQSTSSLIAIWGDDVDGFARTQGVVV